MITSPYFLFLLIDLNTNIVFNAVFMSVLFTTAFCHCQPRNAGLGSGVHTVSSKVLCMFLILHEHEVILTSSHPISLVCTKFTSLRIMKFTSIRIYHCIPLLWLKRYLYWSIKKVLFVLTDILLFPLIDEKNEAKKAWLLERNMQWHSQEELQQIPHSRLSNHFTLPSQNYFSMVILF